MDPEVGVVLAPGRREWVRLLPGPVPRRLPAVACLPAFLQTLVVEADVAPWQTFFLLCARRQFKLLGRDAELLQGRLMQVRQGH